MESLSIRDSNSREIEMVHKEEISPKVEQPAPPSASVGESSDDSDDPRHEQCLETGPDDENISDRYNIDDDDNSAKEKKDTLLSLREYLPLPDVQPTSWFQFGLLSAVCAIPAIIYVAAFTKIGYGLDAFHSMSNYYEDYTPYVGYAIAMVILSLYLMDIQYWNSPIAKIFKALFGLGVFVALCVFVLVSSEDYPFGPISLFAILTPIWLILVHHFSPVFSTIDARTYITWLSGPLLFIAIIVFLYWFIWSFLDDANEYTPYTRAVEAEISGCEPNFDDHPQCKRSNVTIYENSTSANKVCFNVINGTHLEFPQGCDPKCEAVFATCANTFIIWVGPLLVGLTYLFLCFVTTFLRNNQDTSQKMYSFAKFWMVLVFVMWVAASLSGAGHGVPNTLMALTMASFVASGVFFVASFSSEDQKEKVKGIYKTLNEKYGQTAIDAARGLLIVTCAPILLFWVGLSCLKQGLRRIGLPCLKKAENADEWVTENTSRYLEVFYKWDRAKIYTYAVYWGIFFMIFVVLAAKFAYLLLSWLISVTIKMNIFVVTGILIAVGLVMFLLPPVPGVPIYLTLGIIIVAIGREDWGILGCMGYALLVSLLVKLMACTLQQKMIGEYLKGYVDVRRLVAINSSAIRSMKLVLKEPGLGIAKCSILVGGPDWPTSVLCGIMGLDLLPILVGTLPIIFLIIPTMLMGSFIYMSQLQGEDDQLEFPWAGTAATICAAVTAIVQFGSMVIAAYYLEIAVTNRGEELHAIPIDEEVKAKDDSLESVQKAYTKVTQWEIVPTWAKVCLTTALVLQTISGYLVQVFHQNSFEEYQINYTIEEHLRGDWTNLIKTPGRIAILIFCISIGFLVAFIQWANKAAAKELEEHPELYEIDEIEEFNEPA